MGRKKITEKDPRFLSRLVETYMFTGDQKATARELGVGIKTVRKYLHAAGIYPRRGRRRGMYYQSGYKGAFVQWLADHPDVPLPESPSEIARLSGCTVDEIKSHLYRLRQAIAREIAALPDLKTLEAVMNAEDGTPYPFRAIASYSIQIYRHRRRVRIPATLKNGRQVVFNTHLDYLWEVIPKGRMALGLTPSED